MLYLLERCFHMDKLYTLNETKEYLKISDSTIRRYIRDGKIKTQVICRQHRITESEIKAFLNRQGTQNNEEEKIND